MIIVNATEGLPTWLCDRKNRRAIPHRLEQCGYIPVRNADAVDGLFKIGGVGKRSTGGTTSPSATASRQPPGWQGDGTGKNRLVSLVSEILRERTDWSV